MQLKLYSLKDLKTGVYLQPMPQRHDIEAQRALVQLVATTDCTIARYPADYELYYIGEFDDVTASLVPVSPVFIMNGITAVEHAKRDMQRFMGQPYDLASAASA